MATDSNKMLQIGLFFGLGLGLFLGINATGEWEKIDAENVELQPVVSYAITALNIRTRDQQLLADNPNDELYKQRKVAIKKANRQLVAGFNYNFTVITQDTVCRIDEDTAEENCDLNPVGSRQKCNLKVYVKPWLDTKDKELQEDSIRCKEYNKGNKKNKHKNKKNKKDRGNNKERNGKKKRNKKEKKDRSKRSIDRQSRYKKVTSIFPYYSEFEEWRVKYNRTYELDTEEYNLRYEIFEENMEQVKLLNKYESGTAKYGATKFADISADEFQKFYTGLKNPHSFKSSIVKHAKIPAAKAPDAFDWRDHGAVTEVKNQGSCGSCWAFSTTGNIEGQWKIQKGELVSLSEQELVDCDKLDDGCNGGLPIQAYEEIMRIGGMESEKDYAYKGYDEKCEVVKSELKVTISGALNISQDEGEMASWLAANGPISIGINAFAMQFYFGGISYPYKFLCNPDSLDHGVLIVGYGVEGDKPYWIIKNSWGPSWGEKGYYRAYRGAGVCGLNKMCTSSVVQ